MAEAVTFRGVSKRYPGVTALSEVSFSCPAGAVDLRHYSRKALSAEIDGLLKPEHE